MTDRRQPKKAVWKKTLPTKEGYYWYRDGEREVVLHVFESDSDWNGVAQAKYSIADYPGEWYGPLKAPE